MCAFFGQTWPPKPNQRMHWIVPVIDVVFLCAEYICVSFVLSGDLIVCLCFSLATHSHNNNLGLH